MLLDDTIRAQEESGGQHKPEHLGRFRVDHQFEAGGLLDGKVSGLGAFQEPVHIADRGSDKPRGCGE